MLTKAQLTAQELHRWLGLVEELTERYARNTPEDDAKFMAIHRLVGDVERWKERAKEAGDVNYSGEGWDIPSSIMRELRDYKYGGEGSMDDGLTEDEEDALCGFPEEE